MTLNKISRVISKPELYKVCLSCRKINLNKNTSCITCGQTKFKSDKTEILGLAEDAKKAWRYDPEGVMEV